MPIPDFQTFMRPVLAVLEDGERHPVVEIRAVLAEAFALTDEELEERLPSGRDTTFKNRVAWALVHLKGGQFIGSPERGVYVIDDPGRELLARTGAGERIELRLLKEYEPYREFRSRSRPKTETGSPAQPVAISEDEASPPAERIDLAWRELRGAVAAEILERVAEQTPAFFEQVVLDVLEAMGYGGSAPNSAERLGRSGDGGIDGVIREDRLGLDLIYVQAKRWTKPVGRPDIQQFVGALNGQLATKGVFITTSSYSREALEYAATVQPRVVLVDGDELAGLMVDHGVGVSFGRTYRVPSVDLDYFGIEDPSPPPVDA